MATHPTVTDPQSPYFGLNSLYSMAPDGSSIAPKRYNEINGKEIPYFKGNPTQEELNQRFQTLPPNLQQNTIQVAEYVRKMQAQMAEKAPQGPSSSHETPQLTPKPSDHDPKVAKTAEEANVKPKTQTPRFSMRYQIEARNIEVHFKIAYTKPDKYGVSMPIQVEQRTWQEIERVYTKYIEHEDLELPNEGATVQEIFFYEEENGSSFFEIKFLHDKTLKSSRVKVDLEDMPRVKSLHEQYPLVVAPVPQKNRQYRRICIPSNELPKKLKHSVPPLKGAENPYLRSLLTDAIEKSQEMAREHTVEFVHPFTADEFTYEEREELLTRTLLRAGSFITAHRESDYVTKSISSPSSFVKTPHQARVYYDIEPRSGNISSALDSKVAQHLARLYPLHFSVNARLGELQGEDAHLLEEHESAVIYSKRDDLQDQYATLLQSGMNLPYFDDDDFQEELEKAVIDQASRYHEIRQGFKNQKSLFLRDPIFVVGLRDNDENGSIEDRIRLSIFIRIAALYLVNSKPGLKGPKLQLEFEYPMSAHDDKNSVPFYVDFIQEMRERINYALDTDSQNLKDLIQKYSLNDLPLPPSVLTPPLSPLDWERLLGDREKLLGAANINDPHL